MLDVDGTFIYSIPTCIDAVYPYRTCLFRRCSQHEIEVAISNMEKNTNRQLNLPDDVVTTELLCNPASPFFIS